MASTVSKTGYQGFGSFHSDDVELLIRQNAESYVSPSLPFLEPAEETRHSCSKDSFGNAARNQFMIDFGQWTFVNHGAFGGVSQAAYACAEQWRRHCELQPLRFFDRWDIQQSSTAAGVHALVLQTKLLQTFSLRNGITPIITGQPHCTALGTQNTFSKHHSHQLYDTPVVNLRQSYSHRGLSKCSAT